jgi:hypothetical protein
MAQECQFSCGQRVEVVAEQSVHDGKVGTVAKAGNLSNLNHVKTFVARFARAGFFQCSSNVDKSRSKT